MPQCLGAWAPLTEDLGSVTIIHLVAYIICNSSFEESWCTLDSGILPGCNPLTFIQVKHTKKLNQSLKSWYLILLLELPLSLVLTEQRSPSYPPLPFSLLLDSIHEWVYIVLRRSVALYGFILICIDYYNFPSRGFLRTCFITMRTGIFNSHA